MKVSLSELADLQDGYSFRTAVNHEPEGTIQVVEIGDLTQEHERCFLDCKRTNLPKSPKEKYIIKTGDVLVSTVYKYRANLVRSLPENTATICTSSICRLRPKIDEISSEYLSVFLNLPTTKEDFARSANGVGLNRSGLGSLQIPVPSWQKQEEICKIYRLIAEEARLVDQLIFKRSEMLGGLISGSDEEQESGEEQSESQGVRM
jgi:hypothetical protein